MRTVRSLFSLPPHQLVAETRSLLSARAENTAELLAAASRRSCAQVRALLAEREPVGAPISTLPLLAQVVANPQCETDSNQVMSSAGEADAPREAAAAPPPAPPSPSHRVLTFTVPAELADAYREALALAPYEVARDPAQAFAHMLAAWREELAKRRCGEGAHRAPRRASADPRHVPAHARAERERQRAQRERLRAEEAQRRAAADEIVPALRSLGLGAAEARAVAMRVELPPDAPLDQRALAAIRTLGPRRASSAA